MQTKNPVNIKVDRDIALTLSIYCKINRIKMFDYTNEVLGSQLEGFKDKVKVMSTLECDK
jgi:hypothetical protein